MGQRQEAVVVCIQALVCMCVCPRILLKHKPALGGEEVRIKKVEMNNRAGGKGRKQLSSRSENLFHYQKDSNALEKAHLSPFFHYKLAIPFEIVNCFQTKLYRIWSESILGKSGSKRLIFLGRFLIIFIETFCFNIGWLMSRKYRS